MANIKDKMLYFVGNKLLKYVYKNPQKNMLKLIKIGKAVAGKMYPESTFTKPIEIISDPTNVWHKYLFDGLRDIDPDFFCSAALTFAIDLGLNGTKTIRKRREQEHCNNIVEYAEIHAVGLPNTAIIQTSLLTKCAEL